MKKINLVEFNHKLMELGVSSKMASRIVTLCDVMQRDGRQKDVERSRRWRAAKKLAEHEARDTPLSLTASISSSEVKEQAREVVSKKGRKRKTAIPFPEDFAPSESHFAKAAELGCSPAYVLSKCEDMKIWALSNDARKQDWSQTLHGFIRRDADKGRQHGQPNYSQTLRSAVTQLKSGTIAALHAGAGGPSPRPALRLVSAGESDEPGNLHSGCDGGAG